MDFDILFIDVGGSKFVEVSLIGRMLEVVRRIDLMLVHDYNNQMWAYLLENTFWFLLFIFVVLNASFIPLGFHIIS